MAVSKKKVSKRNPKTKAKTKRKPNPSFIEKILGRTGKEYDSIVITVLDGSIELKGEDLGDFYVMFYKLLDSPRKKVDIIFKPRNGRKSYILNRPEPPKDKEGRRDLGNIDRSWREIERRRRTL